LKFLAHDNFPILYLELLRLFEKSRQSKLEILDVTTEYGSGASMTEWLTCAGKQSEAHRPVILLIDDGVKDNQVGVRAMRESQCTFVRLARRWIDEGYDDFCWRLLKVWPDIVVATENAVVGGHQCRIDVSIKGKCTVVNL